MLGWQLPTPPMKMSAPCFKFSTCSSHERVVLTAEAAGAEARAGTRPAELPVEQVEARFGPANSSMTAAIKKCLASGGLLSGAVGPRCPSASATIVLQQGCTLPRAPSAAALAATKHLPATSLACLCDDRSAAPLCCALQSRGAADLG